MATPGGVPDPTDAVCPSLCSSPQPHCPHASLWCPQTPGILWSRIFPLPRLGTPWSFCLCPTHTSLFTASTTSSGIASETALPPSDRTLPGTNNHQPRDVHEGKAEREAHWGEVIRLEGGACQLCHSIWGLARH